MKERDTQRAKLYRAEREALESLKSPLPTITDVERYLTKQCKRKTLRKRYGDAVDLDHWPMSVSDGRGTRNALSHGPNLISLPKWARNDWVTLHEFAHSLHKRLSYARRRTYGRAGTRTYELQGGASHGWQFAAIFLDLVHFCMGKEASTALKAAFKKHRVRWKPKTKRHITPEQRFALQQRMAKARAARSQNK